MREKDAIQKRAARPSKRRAEAAAHWERASANLLERQRDYLMGVIALASDLLAAGEHGRAQAALSAASRMWELDEDPAPDTAEITPPP